MASNNMQKQIDPNMPPLLAARISRGSMTRNAGAEIAEMLGDSALIQPPAEEKPIKPDQEPFSLMDPSKKADVRAQYFS